MPEVSYELPQAIIFEDRPQEGPLDLGRISIAGFVDYEEYTGGANYGRWPYPLLLLDNQEPWERVESLSGTVRRYWHLEDRTLSRMATPLAIVSVPSDGSYPWVHLGSANFPSESHAYLFEPPIAYSQTEFADAVEKIELTYP